MTVLLHGIGFGLSRCRNHRPGFRGFLVAVQRYHYAELRPRRPPDRRSVRGTEAQTLTHNVGVEVIASIVLGGLAASLLNVALMEPLLRSPRITIFLVTVVFGLLVQNVILIIFGGSPATFTLSTSGLIHVGPFLWTNVDIETMASAVVILGALHFVLRYTKFGKALRAVSDNPDLARVTGVPYKRVVRITWLLDGMNGRGPLALSLPRTWEA